MARTQAASKDLIPSALKQLKQMIDGAQSELDAGRPHSSGTLSVSGAVRAVDLICDANLGEHSTVTSHKDAIDLLAKVPGADDLVEDFSLCQSSKTEFNYRASALTLEHAGEVLEAARRLAANAVQGVTEKEWFPSDFDQADFIF